MKLLIADDHELFRGGMRQVLQQLADGAAVVEVLEAADWLAAAATLQQHADLAIAVVDLNMPGTKPYEGLRTLLEAAETVPVVVVSASDSLLDMKQVLDMGAMGYVSKNDPPAILIGALRLVLAGGVYLPPRLMELTAKKNSKGVDSLPFGLTPRQYDVLEALVQGKSTREIADTLGLSEATIKAHLGAVYATLHVSNRQDAIRVVGLSGGGLARSSH